MRSSLLILSNSHVSVYTYLLNKVYLLRDPEYADHSKSRYVSIVFFHSCTFSATSFLFNFTKKCYSPAFLKHRPYYKLPQDIE